MNRLVKPALALGLISAMALVVATPSEARKGRNAAAIGAGVAGFAVGAAIGSAAAANSGYYHQQPYGYYDGYAPAPAYSTGYYDGYAPAPAYTYSHEPAYQGYAYAPRPTRYYGGDPSGYYAPTHVSPQYYSPNYNRERQLRGGDW